MPKYQARLKAADSDQSRTITFSHVSCAACDGRGSIMGSACPACKGYGQFPATEDNARDFLARLERTNVGYNLDTDTSLTDDDRELIAGIGFDDAGKVLPGAGKVHRAKAQLAAQTRSYTIQALEPVEIDVSRLVNELAALQHDKKAWKRVVDGLAEQGIPIAAVTAGLYGEPQVDQWDGTAVTDWDTDTIKTSLHTAYTFAQDTHDRFDDVSGTEITGTGYTAGGATLGSKTVTYDTASDQARLGAADALWTSSTLSATDAVVRKDTGTPSTSPVIAAVDFGGAVTTSVGTLQITWDVTGVIVFDVT